MSTKPAYVTEARMATLLSRFAKAADAALTVRMNEMEQRLRQELTPYTVVLPDDEGWQRGAGRLPLKTTMSEDEAEALLHDLHGFVPGSFEFKPADSTDREASIDDHIGYCATVPDAGLVGSAEEVAHFLRVMAQPESTHDTLLELRAALSETALAKLERMGVL